MLELCGIAGTFSASNKVLLTSILLALEVGGSPAVIPASISAITAYVLTSYTSLHFLQPATSYDRSRARTSLMITMMCDEGRKFLEAATAEECVEPACIISPEYNITDALLKCSRKYAYVLTVDEAGEVSYIRAALIPIYLGRLFSFLSDLTSKIPVIDSNTRLTDVIERITFEKYDALSVIKEGKIVGVVSIEGIERLLRRILFSKCLGGKA